MLARDMMLVSLVASAALAVGCSDETGPAPRGEGAPTQQQDSTEPGATKKIGESNDCVGAGPTQKRAAQSAECAAWLECALEAMPESYPSAVAAYGPDGTCWSSDAPESCTMACTIAMESAASDFPEATRCVPPAETH